MAGRIFRSPSAPKHRPWMWASGRNGDIKRASLSRSSGQWSDDDYDVLENGKVVGRIFFLDAVGPQGRAWMWCSGHGGHIKRAAHGYEPTREEKSWRREW